MDNKKKNMMPNYINMVTDDVEMTLYINKMKNPADLLKKLYILRNDESLNNQEKNEKAKEIISDFMR